VLAGAASWAAASFFSSSAWLALALGVTFTVATVDKTGSWAGQSSSSTLTQAIIVMMMIMIMMMILILIRDDDDDGSSSAWLALALGVTFTVATVDKTGSWAGQSSSSTVTQAIISITFTHLSTIITVTYAASFFLSSVWLLSLSLVSPSRSPPLTRPAAGPVSHRHPPSFTSSSSSPLLTSSS
jgi:hypothetical protein